MSRYLDKLNASNGCVGSEFLGRSTMFGAPAADVRGLKLYKKRGNKNCPAITAELIAAAKEEYFAKGGTVTRIVPEESERKETMDTAGVHSGAHDFLTGE